MTEKRSWEEHQEAVENWVVQYEERYKEHERDIRDLYEALYAFSQLGLWKMGLDIKEAEEAIRVWAVVEKVRSEGFPEDLRV